MTPFSAQSLMAKFISLVIPKSSQEIISLFIWIFYYQYNLGIHWIWDKTSSKLNPIISLKFFKVLYLNLLSSCANLMACSLFIKPSLIWFDLKLSYSEKPVLIVQINNKIIQKNSDFNLIIKDAIL